MWLISQLSNKAQCRFQKSKLSTSSIMSPKWLVSYWQSLTTENVKYPVSRNLTTFVQISGTWVNSQRRPSPYLLDQFNKYSMWSFAGVGGVNGVAFFISLMNRFDKIEAAIFSMQVICFLRTSPFLRWIHIARSMLVPEAKAKLSLGQFWGNQTLK